MNAIECSKISLKLNNKTILDNVSFSVNKGEIFGLIGQNGAGKSSLLRILMGLLVDYNGKITVMEKDLCKSRINMGSVLDNTKLDLNVSAKKNMEHTARLLGCHDSNVERKLLKTVGLEDVCNVIVKKYSLGMKKRLLIAMALIGKPDILVLDEPFNGVDMSGLHDLQVMLRVLSRDGVTILITSHNLEGLLKICDSFGVMYKGKFVKKYEKTDISEKGLRKFIATVDDAEIVISELIEKYPQLCIRLDKENEVSIISSFLESEEEKGINSLRKEFMVKESSVNPEDVLLWKMSGH